MFIHSGTFHIAFNILVQLILGIPLEMVHGKKFEKCRILYENTAEGSSFNDVTVLWREGGQKICDDSTMAFIIKVVTMG